MRKRDIIKLLQTVDDETAVQLGEEYHGISEKDHEKLLKKVQGRLLEQDYSDGEYFLEKVTVKKTRFGGISAVATAAAYVLVFCGILSGLFNMNIVEPADTQQQIFDISSVTADQSITAENMVSSGMLWVKVEKAEFTDKGIYQVTIEVKSENAISLNGTRTFFADNFIAAYTSENGIESVIPPCAISETGEYYDYAFTLEDGECCIITLTYSINTAPDALISGHSEKSFFIKLTED